jgi:hypothetical protein
VLILGLADGQGVLDEAVPPHQHVNGPAEEAREVDDGLVVRSICLRPRRVQGPKYLTTR